MSIEQLASIEGLDVQAGMANCMDDSNLYIEVLRMFALQVEQDAATLKQQFEAQQWQELGKTAHGIKGAASSVGATFIQESAALIEQAGKRGDSDTTTQTFPIFIEQLFSLKSQLDSVL